MRKLLFIFLTLTSLFTYGQTVNSPDAKSFTLNTTGQSASGFSLSGFNSTDILLCAVGLPVAPTGTTFYFTTTTGVTPSVGYTMSGNKTRIAFTGTMANINNVLSSMKVNTTGVTGTIQISVSATVNPTGYYYLPSNGHFYKPMSWPSGSSYQGATSTPYNNLKTLCTQQTFKGQSGYLMTITSADEDNFVYNNVPGSNIIFALTDNVTEGTFKIDAGPESGTTVRIGSTNQQGQYNNWAGGEPNNYGSGEDYVVTKWGGGNQWNDYGPEATAFPGGISGYVIEFGTWSNPDDQTFTDFYSNSVSHSNGNILRTQFDFDFGPIDETKFSVKMFTGSPSQFTPATSSTYKFLNGLGKVDMTTDLDVTKVLGNGYKASTNIGQTEWGVVYAWDGTKHRIGIDKRQFSTSVTPSQITKLKIFDVFDGDVTYEGEDPYWANYTVNTNLTTKLTTSTFSPYIRNGGDYFALKSDFTFGQNSDFKNHSIVFNEMTTAQVQTLYDQIVTISDVYLAFKEYSDKGIMGNESLHFTSGIQFMNADVNGDKIFDEKDCYLLFQHLTGETPLVSQMSLSNIMKLIPKTTYNGITKTNWSTNPTFLGSYFPITMVDNTLNTYDVSVTWKGDVNMSHSATQTTQTTNSLSTTSMMKSMSLSVNQVSTNVNVDFLSEIVGDKVIVTIKVDPTQFILMGTQFKIHYDNLLLKYENSTFTTINGSLNFATNKGDYINVGSLITNGTLGLNNKTEYKLTFSPLSPLTSILGLISIENVESIDINGNKINTNIQ